MNNDLFKMKTLEYGISPLPDDTVPAMAYIPYQNPVMIYTAEQGFDKGTLFPCLDKPFKGCCERRNNDE